MLGRVLAGKYRIEREIGRGAMGIVVAARHVTLGQLVAVKILHDASPNIAARFEREARLAVRLKSEHVAHVIDAGRLDTGEPFIAMEFLDGQDFAALLRERGPMSVEEASSYVMQACEGLAEAHALGMVHRDIKLANLFLAKGAGGLPVVKVLDFGITKADRTSTQSVSLRTEGGALLGTPRYMSPEQVMSSGDVDVRSDVWSIGVVLYTLLSSRAPFDGRTLAEIFRAVLEDPMRPMDAHVPAAVRAIIERCLRKRREERYGSLAELATDLMPFAGPNGPTALRRIASYLGVPVLQPTRPKSRSRILVVAVIALSSAVGAAAVVFPLRRHIAQPTLTPSATATEVVPATPLVSSVMESPQPVDVASSAPTTFTVYVLAAKPNPDGIDAARRKFLRLSEVASCAAAWEELRATPGYAASYDLDVHHATCEMVVGRCNEGRAALRGLLSKSPESPFVKAHSSALDIEDSVVSSAISHCPNEQLSKEELTRRKADAIRSALSSHDVSKATREADNVQALLPLYTRGAVGSKNDLAYHYVIREACEAYIAGARCESARRFCTQVCTAAGGPAEPCLTNKIGNKCVKFEEPGY